MHKHADEFAGLTCCFCAQDTGVSRINPSDINIITNCDKAKDKEQQMNQTFWCHIECFRTSLHAKMKRYLVLDIVPYHTNCIWLKNFILKIVQLKEYINRLFEGPPKQVINESIRGRIFLCCFCYTYIESTHVDPCDINVLTNWDKVKRKQDNQTFYCHAECLKKVLHETIRGYLVIPTFDDEE